MEVTFFFLKLPANKGQCLDRSFLGLFKALALARAGDEECM